MRERNVPELDNDVNVNSFRLSLSKRSKNEADKAARLEIDGVSFVEVKAEKTLAVQIRPNPPVMYTLSKHTGGHTGECYVSGATAITSDRPCLCLCYSPFPHSGVVSL